MAAVDKVTAKGVSGAEYAFDVWPWGVQFTAVGGVYMVLRQNDKAYDVLYVGQTGDLSERFDNHHKQRAFDAQQRTHIAAMGAGLEARRRAVEKDLIEAYNPPCNS